MASTQVPLQKVIEGDALVLRNPVTQITRLYEAELVTVVDYAGLRRLRGRYSPETCQKKVFFFCVYCFRWAGFKRGLEREVSYGFRPAALPWSVPAAREPSFGLAWCRHPSFGYGLAAADYR